jgi:hypothetical protein
MVFHYDGTAWTRLDPGLPEPVRSIWSSGPDDLWVLGLGVTRHFDGESWTDIVPAWPIEVWGTRLDDAWAQGSGGTALHYDGSSWSNVTLNTGHVLLSFGGSGPGNVWAVGERGIVRHLGHDMPRTVGGGACAEPIAIYCNTSVLGTTSPAGPRRIDRYTCDQREGERDTPGSETYYRIVTPVTGTARVHLQPHGGDLDLFVLDDAVAGACAPTGCLGASQREAAILGEDVQVETRTGDRMYIVVDSPTEAGGSYSLSVACDKQ